MNTNPLIYLVGTEGFEPSTPCTPCKCATRLRYAPKDRKYSRANALSQAQLTRLRCSASGLIEQLLNAVQFGA